MDPSALLINVSQLIQVLILVGEGMRLRQQHWGLLVKCLTLLEGLVGEMRRCGDSLQARDLEGVVLLRDALLKARDLADENAAIRSSKVFNVVCCEEICGWFQEICQLLQEALSCISFDSLGIQAQLATQELQRTRFIPDISDEMLGREIDALLEEMSLHQHVRPEKLVKLFDKLEIISDEALVRELDSLESLKNTARASKEKAREEFYERLISLLMQMVKNSPEGLQVKSEARAMNIPADLRCPLSLELMGDPVIISSGQTYERAYIQLWIDQGNTSCPKTRQVLAHTNVIPNYTVKALINNWCEAHNVPLPGPAKLGSSIILKRFPRCDESMNRTPDGDGVDECNSTNINIDNSSNNNSSNSNSSKNNGSPVGGAAREKGDEGSEDLQHGEESGFSFTGSPRGSLRSVRSVRSHSFAGASPRSEDWSFVPKQQSRLSGLRASPSGSSGSSDNGAQSEIHEVPRTPGTVVSIDASIDLSDYSPYASDASGEFGSPARSPPTMTPTVHSFPSLMRSARKQRQQQQQQQLLRKASSARSITDGALRILIENSVEDLLSDNTELQLAAAEELRLLAKYDAENRVLIAASGAIPPLVALVSSGEKLIQENAVTALLNLSINDTNKSLIVSAGAVDPLVEVLKSGNQVARENSAAALFMLSVPEENKPIIGCSGAIAPLVDLLVNGSLRGQKDAATALFNLSLLTENKARIVSSGAVPAFVSLIKNPNSGMVDKAVAVVANLMTTSEGRVAIGEAGGIPALVEVVEAGSARGKENAAAALLHLCTNSTRHRSMVLQEGAIPPLHALSQNGTPRAKEKASALLRHFREQRHASFGSSRSGSQQF